MRTIGHAGRPVSAVAVTSPALAGCGALSLVLGDAVLRTGRDPDGLSVLFFVLGWVLVVWASIGVVVTFVQLIRAGRRRRRLALIELALVLAAVVVIVGTARAYPLIGTGSGVA